MTIKTAIKTTTFFMFYSLPIFISSPHKQENALLTGQERKREEKRRQTETNSNPSLFKYGLLWKGIQM
jgi:hypothetical protein